MPTGGRDKLPKKNKNNRPEKAQPPKSLTQESTSGSVLQQKCLNLFRDAFHPDPHETAILQEVKAHLYNRDFATAFGKTEYLEVYAARWSPSRALGYHQILTDLKEHITPDTDVEEQSNQATGTRSSPHLKVVCLGGGAGAEIAALATWWTTLIATDSSRTLEATFIDMADWSTIISTLHNKITSAPDLSRYASAAIKEANVALLPESTLRATFLQRDILTWTDDTFSSTLAPAHLVTLLFTLNELYSVSLPQTQAFLSRLTETVQPGCLLLVVDSPGSYSTVSINGAEKKYPMQWLLDHTLVGSAARSSLGTPRWEKLESDDSRWFRLPSGLKYPIELENMRYQIHLYQRLSI